MSVLRDAARPLMKHTGAAIYSRGVSESVYQLHILLCSLIFVTAETVEAAC